MYNMFVRPSFGKLRIASVKKSDVKRFYNTLADEKILTIATIDNIHTVLHLNKGDDNTRGHLGTELNNKAETVLQITKDDFERDISSVAAMHIRDRDFEPFAFRINADGLPELVEDYQLRQTTAAKSFDYAEVSADKHREALELLFSEADRVSYSSLIGRLQSSYASIGHSFGINKAKQLKVFLENKRMIVKEDRFYCYNPDFHY